MQRKNVDMKVVLVGRKGSGKTALHNRYVSDIYEKTSMTIGAYYGEKQIEDDTTTARLCLWDTAGEEKFASLVSFYCRNAALFIYAIDGSEEKPDLAQDVRKIEAALFNSPTAEVHIAITKHDFVPENIAPESAEAFKEARAEAIKKAIEAEIKLSTVLKDKQIEVTITSAKTGAGVNDTFERPAKKILEKAAQKEQSEHKAQESNDARLVKEMKQMSDDLSAEINSCLPYPNKSRKRLKRDFLNRVIAEYKKGVNSLSVCVADIEKQTSHDIMQEVIAGKKSKRTSSFFQRNQLKLLTQSSQTILYTPLISSSEMKKG